MRATRWSALGLGLIAGGALAADICEPLREHNEFQIASTGATGFAVVVVDADAEVPGKVVGTCARGARKLVYVRGAGSEGVARPLAAALASRSKDEDIITECRDGTVVRGNAACGP